MYDVAMNVVKPWSYRNDDYMRLNEGTYVTLVYSYIIYYNHIQLLLSFQNYCSTHPLYNFIERGIMNM